MDHSAWRDGLLCRHGARIDGDDTVSGRNPRVAVAVERAGREGVAVGLAAAHAIGPVDDFRRQPAALAAVDFRELRSVDAEHALVAGQPECVIVGGQDAEQGFVRHAAFVAEGGEASFAESDQATIAADPHRAIGIGQEVEGGFDGIGRIAVAVVVAQRAVGGAIADAVGGADPQSAGGIFVQRPHDAVFRQRCVTDFFQAAIGMAPHQSHHGADPQAAIAPAEQRADLGGGQSIGTADAQHRLRRIVRQADKSLVVGAQPDAFAVFGQAHDRPFPAVLPGHVDGLQLAFVPAVDPARAADPDAAVAGGEHAAHVVVEQAQVGVQRARDAVGDADQAIAGAGPDQAFAVLHQGKGGATPQAHGTVDAREVVGTVPDQQAVVVGVRPDVAFGVLQQGVDAQRRNRRDGFETVAADVAHVDAVVGADQQATVAQAQRRQHHRRGQAILFVEQGAGRGIGNAGDQAVLGAGHQAAFAIGCDAIDPRARDQRAVRPPVQPLAIAVDMREATFGAHPPALLAVGHHHRHPEIVQRFRRQRRPRAVAVGPEALPA